jgi:hypothetical protein
MAIVCNEVVCDQSCEGGISILFSDCFRLHHQEVEVMIDMDTDCIYTLRIFCQLSRNGGHSQVVSTDVLFQHRLLGELWVESGSQ